MFPEIVLAFGEDEVIVSVASCLMPKYRGIYCKRTLGVGGSAVAGGSSRNSISHTLAPGIRPSYIVIVVKFIKTPTSLSTSLPNKSQSPQKISEHMLVVNLSTSATSLLFSPFSVTLGTDRYE